LGVAFSPDNSPPLWDASVVEWGWCGGWLWQYLFRPPPCLSPVGGVVWGGVCCGGGGEVRAGGNTGRGAVSWGGFAWASDGYVGFGCFPSFAAAGRLGSGVKCYAVGRRRGSGRVRVAGWGGRWGRGVLWLVRWSCWALGGVFDLEGRDCVPRPPLPPVEPPPTPSDPPPPLTSPHGLVGRCGGPGAGRSVVGWGSWCFGVWVVVLVVSLGGEAGVLPVCCCFLTRSRHLASFILLYFLFFVCSFPPDRLLPLLWVEPALGCPSPPPRPHPPPPTPTPPPVVSTPPLLRTHLPSPPALTPAGGGGGRYGAAVGGGWFRFAGRLVMWILFFSSKTRSPRRRPRPLLAPPLSKGWGGGV